MVKFVQADSETLGQNLSGMLKEGRPRDLVKANYLASFLLIFWWRKDSTIYPATPEGKTLQAVRIRPWKSNFENDIPQIDQIWKIHQGGAIFQQWEI